VGIDRAAIGRHLAAALARIAAALENQGEA